MTTLRNSISLAGLALLLLLAPALRAAHTPRAHTKRHAAPSATVGAPDMHLEAIVSSLYERIALKEAGLTRQAFDYAYRGYAYLIHHHVLGRTDVLSICDFSQSSRNKRLYVVDMSQQKLLMTTYVAHGRKSGGEYAHTFSNSNRSHKSSLGFYITDQTYWGDHGLSLKIRGLEKGFNDRAARRSIVVHGSRYVGQNFLEENPINGRSFGCPAVPYQDTEQLIETIKGGSCLFIYHPTKKYLVKSKILNS